MKELDFMLALAVCLMMPISGLPQTVQQYIIAIPVLMLIFAAQHIKNHSILVKKQLVILEFCLILSFVVTAFTFGIHLRGIESLMGIMMIPFIIQIFSQKGSMYFFKYFWFLFSLYEIVLLFFVAKDHVWFNVYRFGLIREHISWAFPNYFAMLSAVKAAISSHLFQKGLIKKSHRNITILLSLMVVISSLSRTALIMAIIMFVTPLITTKGIIFIKNPKITVPIIFLFIGAITAFILKGGHQSSSILRSMNRRFDEWSNLLVVVKDHPFLGIGFRSTSMFVTSDINTAHNDYLDILTKGGIVMFVVIYSFFISRLLKLYKQKNYFEFSVLLAILAGGMTQNPLKFFPLFLIFGVMIAKSYEPREEVYIPSPAIGN